MPTNINGVIISKKEIKTFPCRRRQISFHLVFNNSLCVIFFSSKKEVEDFLILGHQDEDRRPGTNIGISFLILSFFLLNF